MNLYLEKYAKAKSLMTAKKLAGVATYLPIMDVMGREIHDKAEGYDLHMITYREISQTKSRTVVDYWLNAIQDTNHVLLNSKDAGRFSLKDGDEVRVTSRAIRRACGTSRTECGSRWSARSRSSRASGRA